jgi:P-type Cu+ transporter
MRHQEAVAVFRVPGMSTPGRARRLKREIGKLDGILEVEINYILDTASVSYEAHKLTRDQIKEKIEA